MKCKLGLVTIKFSFYKSSRGLSNQEKIELFVQGKLSNNRWSINLDEYSLSFYLISLAGDILNLKKIGPFVQGKLSNIMWRINLDK